jgi:hypothetical protein
MEELCTAGSLLDCYQVLSHGGTWPFHQLPFAIDGFNADTHRDDHPFILNMFGPLHVLVGSSVDRLDMVACLHTRFS